MKKNFLSLFFITTLLLPSVRCRKRGRMHMEIEPISAEQSLTAYGDEKQYGAQNAIDMETSTVATAFANPETDYRTWIRVNFAKVYCIEEIKWFRVNGISKYFLGDWIKGADGTWSCKGHVCNYMIVAIQNSGREANYRPITEDGCNFGDFVHLELGARIPAGEIEVADLAVVGRRVDPLCGAGYSLVEGSCEECPENSFSADGDNTCTPCPEGSTSPAGSSECTPDETTTSYTTAASDTVAYSTEPATEEEAPDNLLADTSFPEPDMGSDKPDSNPTQHPTCECWTPECGFCTDKKCTLQTNISVTGLEVTARLKWRTQHTIILYDQEGEKLGKLHWSLSKISLSYCITCITPRELRALITQHGFSTWTFLLQDGFLRVQVEGEVLYERKMSKWCWQRYQRASRFAFTKTSCEDSFSFVKDEMKLGDMMTSDCSGTCLQQ